MPLPEGERAPLFSILVLLHKSVWMGDVMSWGRGLQRMNGTGM